jgi:hypothetical protein
MNRYYGCDPVDAYESYAEWYFNDYADGHNDAMTMTPRRYAEGRVDGYDHGYREGLLDAIGPEHGPLERWRVEGFPGIEIPF